MSAERDPTGPESADRESVGSDDGLLRAIVIVLAAILLLPILMMVIAMPMMGMIGMGMGGMGGVGYSPLMGVLMGLVPLLALVAVGYLVYRAVVGRETVRVTDPALEELRLAYARGELSDEEFEERRDRLRTGGEE